MPFSAGAYTRTKTFANLGTYLENDFNSAQDDMGNQLNIINKQIGINDTSVIRRGGVYIATEESISSPDHPIAAIDGITLKQDSILVLMLYFQAKFSSFGGGGNVSIYLNNNLLTSCFTGDSNSVQTVVGSTSSSTVGTLNIYRTFTSYPVGLSSGDRILDDGTPGIASAGEYTGNVSTGQIFGHAVSKTTKGNKVFGGPMYIFANAGVYNIHVQASSDCQAKQRYMYVYTIDF